MSNGHFGTSAEMSWVRSVLGPKCPYTFKTKQNAVGRAKSVLGLCFVTYCMNFIFFDFHFLEIIIFAQVQQRLHSL